LRFPFFFFSLSAEATHNGTHNINPPVFSHSSRPCASSFAFGVCYSRHWLMSRPPKDGPQGAQRESAGRPLAAHASLHDPRMSPPGTVIVCCLQNLPAFPPHALPLGEAGPRNRCEAARPFRSRPIRISGICKPHSTS
jgi:hypothetical protein